MKKDFDQWNEEKKRLDDAEVRIFFNERDVWWCSIGVNVGFEEDGKGDYFARPLVVFKKFNNSFMRRATNCQIPPFSGTEAEAVYKTIISPPIIMSTPLSTI